VRVVRGPFSTLTAKTERSNGNNGYIKRVFDTVSLHDFFFSSVLRFLAKQVQLCSRKKKGEVVIALKGMLHKL
jgi:hypothetical protein